MDPLSLGSGILAGVNTLGSIIGGVSSANSVKDTNWTNLQIADATNKQNERLFNQSLAWQEDMWNKTNSYNSPKNQVAMLLKAGINPAAVYGNGSTALASTPSIPSAPEMKGATMMPTDYSFIGQGVTSGIDEFFNSQIQYNAVKKSASDAKIASVQAEFDALTMMNRAARIANDTSKSKVERDAARLELKFLTTTFDERVMQNSQLTKIQDQQYQELVEKVGLAKAQRTALDIANKYAPAMNEQSLRNIKANISAAYAAARASDASALDASSHAAVNDVLKAGYNLDNNQKKILFSTVKSTAEAEAKKAREGAENLRLQNEKLRGTNRYGEVGYRALGSALPETEDKIKNVIKTGIKGATKVGRVYKRGVKQGERKVRH